MQGKLAISLLCLVALFLKCCNCDSRSAWTQVISKCAASDKIGPNQIYFGASNTIGPGSVWRKDTDGSYKVLFEFSDMFPQQADRDKILHPNNVATCQGTSSTSWEVKGDLPFQGGATPVSGDISADLKSASKITVAVNGWSTVDLKETDWKAAVAQLDNSNVFKKDLVQDNRFLAETAVLVSGFSSSFEFSKDVAVNLKAKYPTGKIISTSGDGISLQANWTSDTTLTLNSPGDFFITADYAELKSGSPENRSLDARIKDLQLQPVVVKDPSKTETGNEREEFLKNNK